MHTRVMPYSVKLLNNHDCMRIACLLIYSYAFEIPPNEKKKLPCDSAKLALVESFKLCELR